MPSDAVSVTLALGYGPHQKTLPSSLLAAGMLRQMFVHGPCPEVRDARDGTLKVIKRFPFNALANRVAWAIWRRLPQTIRPRSPSGIAAWATDRRLAKWVEPSSIFHGRGGICLASLGAARQHGALTLVETGMRHPRFWQQSVSEERRRFGVDLRGDGEVFSERRIRHMEREYQACDKLVVLSSAARRSFEEFGHGSKVEVIVPGIDHTYFTPPVKCEPSSAFRVCYVGRVELAKGLGYLLQAWKRLALPQAELLLIGEVRPDMSAMLTDCATAGVKLTGFLPPHQVAEHYRRSDLFVFPSVNEGFGVVLLEAMASGLPVVAAKNTGADECVTEGEEGIVVPVRDVDALAEALLWCYRHRDEIQRMGKAARAKIENQFTLDHYNERIIALYLELARTHP